MDLKTVALLNSNDPERLRVEQEICQTPEGREAWLQAVQEAEELRANLRTVSASPEAVARALQVSRPKPRSARGSLYITGVAAAVILSLGGWWVAEQQHTGPKIMAATFDREDIRKIELDPDVKRIALLAMENFEERDKALTSANDVEALLVNLPESSSLPKQVPDLAPLQQMTGGKVVTLVNQPALLTRWKETVSSGETHDMALQQLYAADLGLPSDMNPVLVHIDPQDETARPTCDVLLWTQDGTAYMLVANSSDGCAKRALQTLRQKIGAGYPVSPTA